MKLIATVSLLFLVVAGQAQTEKFTGVEAEVYQVIIDLFDGMRAGDSAKIRPLFHAEARMYSCFKRKDGSEAVHAGDLQKFLTALGEPHDLVWDERIRNTRIVTYGNLAQAWTEYGFYAGTRFSHCGVDAFTMVRENGRWRILSLVDTKQTRGCDWELN